MLLINGEYIREGEDGNIDCINIAEEYVNYEYSKELEKRLAGVDELKKQMQEEADMYERSYDGLTTDCMDISNDLETIKDILNDNFSKGRIKTEYVEKVQAILEECLNTLGNWI